METQIPFSPFPVLVGLENHAIDVIPIIVFPIIINRVCRQILVMLKMQPASSQRLPLTIPIHRPIGLGMRRGKIVQPPLLRVECLSFSTENLACNHDLSGRLGAVGWNPQVVGRSIGLPG